MYPAIETGLGAREAGHDVRYLGSERGQEGDACAKAQIPFTAFPSQPIPRIASLAGLRGLAQIHRCAGMARQELERVRPDAVLSTGGFSSAPVVQAAKKLGIPIVIHEQNAAPGRTNKLLSRHAASVCTVFEASAAHFPGARVVRTGMPIRREIRLGGQGVLPLDEDYAGHERMILVMGGSQGSAALNEAALACAIRMAGHGLSWLHITGTKHFEAVSHTRETMGVKGAYFLRSYLDARQMALAYASCVMAVSRSGAGSITELAAHRRPAVYVPYPYAHSRHQHWNAVEIRSRGGGDVYEQDQLDAVGLEGRILAWLEDSERIRHAQEGLADWDIVDAVPRILACLDEAAGARR